MTYIWHISDSFLTVFCNWQFSDRFQTDFWHIHGIGGTYILTEYQVTAYLDKKRQNPIEWRVFIIPVALTRTCIPIRFHTCYGWLHFWDRVWGTDIEFESSKIHKARHVRLHSLKSARELFPGSKGNSQWRMFHWIIAFDLCKVHHATWRNTAHVKIDH